MPDNPYPYPQTEDDARVALTLLAGEHYVHDYLAQEFVLTVLEEPAVALARVHLSRVTDETGCTPTDEYEVRALLAAALTLADTVGRLLDLSYKYDAYMRAHELLGRKAACEAMGRADAVGELEEWDRQRQGDEEDV